MSYDYDTVMAKFEKRQNRLAWLGVLGVTLLVPLLLVIGFTVTSLLVAMGWWLLTFAVAIPQPTLLPVLAIAGVVVVLRLLFGGLRGGSE